MSEVIANSGLLSKTKVHVEDTGGTGRPVVLIHGWPLSGQSWQDQVGPLSQAGYRVVSYDRRGFGRSDKPHGGYDYDTLADDLEGVLSELDLRDVTLVGFSMGGGEVARYITKHGQDRLRSAVFAAAVPPYLAQTEDNPQGPLTQELADQMETGLKEDRDAFFDQFMKPVLLRRRRDEGQRAAAPGRNRALPPVRPEGSAGLHGGVRHHRLPWRSAQCDRADPRHPR